MSASSPNSGILVFRHAEAPKLRRRGTTKSKSGCLVCKVRRIKCDESRPVCQQCVKRDSQNKCCWPEIPAKSSFYTIKPNLHQIQQPQFACLEECRYFIFFRDQTLISLSGNCLHGIWSTLVLQASETEQAIRLSVIALGALDFAEHAAKEVQAPSSNVDPEIHRYFALEQYSGAVRHMREAVSEGRQSKQVTLLFCIVTACFEIYNGSYECAYTQIRTGLNLLADWKQRRRVRSKKGQDAVDDELGDILARLDLCIMAFLDKSSPIYLEYAMTSEEYECLPETFENISEARHWCDYLMRELMEFRMASSTHRSRDPNGTDPRTYAFDTISSRICCKNTSPRPSDSKQTDTRTIDLPANRAAVPESTWKIYPHSRPCSSNPLQQLARWKKAFEPLLDHAKTQAGKKDYPAAISLQCAYLYLHIIFSFAQSVTTTPTSLSEAEMLFDDHNPVFAELVRHCGIMMSHPDIVVNRTCFSFDFPLVVPLQFTGRHCRDPTIRRKAIALMCSASRREGVWDMQLSGMTAKWIMDIEEKNIENGVVPEWSRLSRSGVWLRADSQFELGERRALVSCVQPKKVPNEETVVLEKEFIW